MSRQPLRTLYEDDGLRVRWRPGRGDVLAVACAGIGRDLTGAPPDEMVRIASGDGTRPAAFVVDKRRSWFHGAGVLARAAEAVAELAGRIGAREIVTMGNSMGGFGAMALSRALPVSRCLALVPQFSIDPRVLADKRWRDLAAAIDAHRLGTAADLIGARSRYVIVHGTQAADMAHVRRFPLGPGVMHWIVPGAQHDLSAHLRREGALAPLADALVAGDEDIIASVMARFGAYRRRGGLVDRAALWLAARDDGPSRRLLARLCPPAVVPA